MLYGVRPAESCDTEPVSLRRGLKGKVMGIDDDGFACVDFIDLGGRL